MFGVDKWPAGGDPSIHSSSRIYTRMEEIYDRFNTPKNSNLKNSSKETPVSDEIEIQRNQLVGNSIER
jgi:hypothetical protein